MSNPKRSHRQFATEKSGPSCAASGPTRCQSRIRCNEIGLQPSLFDRWLRRVDDNLAGAWTPPISRQRAVPAREGPRRRGLRNARPTWRRRTTSSPRFLGRVRDAPSDSGLPRPVARVRHDHVITSSTSCATRRPRPQLRPSASSAGSPSRDASSGWRARCSKSSERERSVPATTRLGPAEQQAMLDLHGRFPLEGCRRATSTNCCRRQATLLSIFQRSSL